MSRNMVSAIRESQRWIHGQKSIGKFFVQKFNDLFAINNLTIPNSLDVEDRLRFITKDMNLKLIRILMEEEIKTAIWSLHLLKALGLDGFSEIFYRNYWDTVKIHEAFITLDVSSMTNRSLIMLIPKVKHPTEFNHYRPISLCNFSYKIISKILSILLQHHFPKIISQNQGALRSTFIMEITKLRHGSIYLGNTFIMWRSKIKECGRLKDRFKLD